MKYTNNNNDEKNTALQLLVAGVERKESRGQQQSNLEGVWENKKRQPVSNLLSIIWCVYESTHLFIPLT